jgi:hypothetical protein
MPAALIVYEPSITYDGTTSTLTYTVKVSTWPESGLPYKAPKAAAEASKAEPQSIEALIWHYGASGTAGLFSETVTSVTAGTEYKLKTTEELPPYVIIPLDTPFIKGYLTKRLLTGKPEDTGLVWIEENPAIGKVETVNTAGEANWKEGTYEDTTGLRISGLAKPDADVVIAGTIGNFDDGGLVSEENDTLTRIPSIATVFADGTTVQSTRYTSTINFYTDSDATAIRDGLKGPAGGSGWKVADVKLWMKDHKPALRVVYQWAD